MKRRSNIQVMSRLIGLVKPLTGYMILAITLGLLGHLCATWITIFGGYAVLNVLGYSALMSLQTIFIVIAIIAILRGFLRYGEQACNHFIAFKLLALIRNHIFVALRKLCPAKLEGKDKGNLISVITADIELLEVFYAHTISPAAIALLFSILMSLFIGSFHWLLGIIALAAYICVGVVIPVLISKLNGDLGKRFRQQSGELSSFVLDSLRGLLETIQYGTGQQRLQEMNRQTDELSLQEEKMKRIAGRNTAITNTVILGFDLLMLWASTLLSMKGVIGFDGVLIPVIALMSSFGPVVALANLGSTLQNTFAAGNRVLDILDETPVVQEISGQPNISFEKADVDHVTFSYGGETILSDISIDIPKHSVIGISGRSGSGKSTLLKLLMRFWSVQQGKIQISNTDIDAINTQNLRDLESFVTQETHLFHDTIANNLKIAKLDATQEEIEQACKQASVHDFIMSLPNGYETQVGELGDTLSGGEQQRLGLARAFLHDAPLMLLDEPTSNLDSLNEAVILKSLQEEREGKTVILVSHRKSTMRIADQVYSVEHGRMS
ncbi:MAG: thiol reductant ABC exporter subunit CydC [Erysipelotrichaceae bacterium]|nr:thiol reductant ABC exporter subunit CydC [Erysipelotrichaceae bacterium]